MLLEKIIEMILVLKFILVLCFFGGTDKLAGVLLFDFILVVKTYSEEKFRLTFLGDQEFTSIAVVGVATF